MKKTDRKQFTQTGRRIHPSEKLKLHPRNKHRERYDFQELIKSCAELAPFVLVNKYEDESIDFFNPNAVKMLNKALLKHFYGIENWDIPKNYLCPPIPGRADYIHNIADLLALSFGGKIPLGESIKVLDVGVGANCVYPIIGNSEYAWSFVGSDIDPVSIESATKIMEQNPSLKGKIELRLQQNSEDIFRGIIQKDDFFKVSMCNPPFHASLAEAQSGTIRKISNLSRQKATNPILNFGGQSNELWCEGGEERFVRNMIQQSAEFSKNCQWFTSIISKESNLKSVYHSLENVNVAEVITIQMRQGNKITRFVAWTF